MGRLFVAAASWSGEERVSELYVGGRVEEQYYGRVHKNTVLTMYIQTHSVTMHII